MLMAIFIGPHTRILPQGSERFLNNVRMQQGSQILRVPEGSRISNVVFGGGASCNSRWAALRGAVLKFAPDRLSPVDMDGNGYNIPSGHTLMDRQSYNWIVANKNNGRNIPHIVVRSLSLTERFYLAHTSYCHPNQLFLPQGKFTSTTFLPRNILDPHMQMKDKTLIVNESQLTDISQPTNILAGLKRPPRTIKVKLAEDGLLTLSDRSITSQTSDRLIAYTIRNRSK
jgi:hypothetical protein